VALGSFEQEALHAARERHCAEAGSLRRLRMGEVLDRLNHLVERVDANDADRLGDRVEALQRAGERAGMRERCLAALLGAADLDRHDWLAGIARIRARGPERLRLPGR